MNPKSLRIASVFCLALVLAAQALPAAAAPAGPDLRPVAKAARIANAESAAPTDISKNATVLDWPAKAGDPMVVLRQGTNGWTCYTDWADSPGNDPECNDPIAEGWLSALFAGKDAPPKATQPGIAYMLAGGSDPSNTDPMAAAPAPGEDWISTGAHIMLIQPGGFDAKDYSTDPNSGQPWIMWDGTPYEHLMIPVTPMKASEMGKATKSMRSAESAAPAGVAAAATLLDFLPETTDPLIVPFDMALRRQGTNGWTCIADWPDSPGNDPSCNDAVWSEWNDAYAAGKAPKITHPGIGYMLGGGSDPSATDPAATAPAPGEDWVNSPGHVMLLVPGGFDAKVFSTDPKSGFPYIMWDGTPYEHLMVPLANVSE